MGNIIDFIQFEADDESQQNETISFSDHVQTEEDNRFIIGYDVYMENVNLYRKFDPENIGHDMRKKKRLSLISF